MTKDSRPTRDEVVEAFSRLENPGRGWLKSVRVFATALGLTGAALTELRSLPLGALGQQLMALRYLIQNGDIWRDFFAWEAGLSAIDPAAPEQITALLERLTTLQDELPDTKAFAATLAGQSLPKIAGTAQEVCALSEEALKLLLGIARDADARNALRQRLNDQAIELFEEDPRVCDVIYLLSQDLAKLPATTVGEGRLDYIVVADKGEMGVRATREAIRFGAVPVVLHSASDDANALQVRIAREAGGFAIPLDGSFRESYANAAQIVTKVQEAYADRFGTEAAAHLARSALYPGYGPLAENGAAIELFRRSGVVFIGPPQDVVERAGDKRKFRELAESIDPSAVTPGIILKDTEPEAILEKILVAHREGRFALPGRLKAANGGGGRGQAIVQKADGIPGAVRKVLGEIAANGWDPGVMFEQNIPRTIHLEVQVVRDRYGNTRHFGMRDCSEQRASQKIQEEAPPALLRDEPKLEARMCEVAVAIADAVDYVGACTVELMFKDGHFYLLEMNTRIQVEHPVSEEAHEVRLDGEQVPLNLVQLQFQVARGAPIRFEQSDVVRTALAREFRINAESYRADIKDSRDGQRGMFVPNAGIFDVVEVPSPEAVLAALEEQEVFGVDNLSIRFDCGFEVGDVLVNKDPTFGKLIIAVEPSESHEAKGYELLRLASIEVLKQTRIEGRKVLPSGKIIRRSKFETNIDAHIFVLETECLREHSEGIAPDRHVNWVIDAFRSEQG